MREEQLTRVIRCALVTTVLLAVAAQSPAQQRPSQEPVPSWLAWKVFHDSLAYYGQRSTEQVHQMLMDRFGLSHAQAAQVLSAGQSFLAAIRRVDDDAIAEAKRRYPDIPTRENLRSKALRVHQEKTVRERAIDDGLYALVEAKKQAALDTHLSALTRSLSGATVEQLRQYIQTSIIPHIQTFADLPAPAAPKGLPPGFGSQQKVR